MVHGHGGVLGANARAIVGNHELEAVPTQDLKMEEHIALGLQEMKLIVVLMRRIFSTRAII